MLIKIRTKITINTIEQKKKKKECEVGEGRNKTTWGARSRAQTRQGAERDTV